MFSSLHSTDDWISLAVCLSPNSSPTIEQKSLKMSFLCYFLMIAQVSRTEGKRRVWTISKEYNLECFGWLEKITTKGEAGKPICVISCVHLERYSLYPQRFIVSE